MLNSLSYRIVLCDCIVFVNRQCKALNYAVKFHNLIQCRILWELWRWLATWRQKLFDLKQLAALFDIVFKISAQRVLGILIIVHYDIGIDIDCTVWDVFIPTNKLRVRDYQRVDPGHTYRHTYTQMLLNTTRLCINQWRWQWETVLLSFAPFITTPRTCIMLRIVDATLHIVVTRIAIFSANIRNVVKVCIVVVGRIPTRADHLTASDRCFNSPSVPRPLACRL